MTNLTLDCLYIAKHTIVTCILRKLLLVCTSLNINFEDYCVLEINLYNVIRLNDLDLFLYGAQHHS